MIDPRPCTRPVSAAFPRSDPQSNPAISSCRQPLANLPDERHQNSDQLVIQSRKRRRRRMLATRERLQFRQGSTGRRSLHQGRHSFQPCRRRWLGMPGSPADARQACAIDRIRGELFGLQVDTKSDESLLMRKMSATLPSRAGVDGCDVLVGAADVASVAPSFSGVAGSEAGAALMQKCLHSWHRRDIAARRRLGSLSSVLASRSFALPRPR